MDISIIIPTYNEEKFIVPLLKSVIKQKFRNMEVIIVDGNSKDNTIQKIKSIKCDQLTIKLIRSTFPNLESQRNIGARNAKSNLLVFLDADTIITPSFLSNIKPFMKNQGLDVSIPLYSINDTKWYRRLFFWSINYVFNKTQKIRPCGSGMCIISTKKYYKMTGGFDESLVFADLKYFNKLKYSKKFSIFPRKLICSTRRFSRDGSTKTMFIWINAYFHFLINKFEKIQDSDYYQRAY